MPDKRVTRRDFLKICGKSVSLLALFSGVIRFDAPARAESESPLFVNSLIRGEEQLKVVFLQRHNEEKSDSFLLMYLSEAGLDLTLHDGGLNDRQTYMALMNLREEILAKANVPEAEKARYMLNFRMVISHFHMDHTEGLYGLIVRTRKKLHVDEVYMPPATALPRGIYSDAHNGDLTHRVKLHDALKKFQPHAVVHTLSFGDTCIIPTDCGEIRLFAPVSDWAEESKRDLFETGYGYKNAASRPTSLPIAILNANSMWMRASLGDHVFLFTGDVEKRIPERNDEPMDEMIAAYGEALRADIIKYPHHGQQRNAAAALIRDKLITSKAERMCILTAANAPQQAGAALQSISLPWIGIENGSLIYTVKNGRMTIEIINNATQFL